MRVSECEYICVVLVCVLKAVALDARLVHPGPLFDLVLEPRVLLLEPVPFAPLDLVRVPRVLCVVISWV